MFPWKSRTPVAKIDWQEKYERKEQDLVESQELHEVALARLKLCEEENKQLKSWVGFVSVLVPKLKVRSDRAASLSAKEQLELLVDKAADEKWFAREEK